MFLYTAVIVIANIATMMIIIAKKGINDFMVRIEFTDCQLRMLRLLVEISLRAMIMPVRQNIRLLPIDSIWAF
ncbi:hypothetical protein BS640_13665 [Rouxiella badensis]|uniref:Uncharacterized protein n=1 Tax=Rouxiella badensis TaxID=1646377 RepID=A0A1X0WDR2_9GAMM|nr:hypothetical protein BS640_13665 [Rouxiella badensis]